jgi:hypothetical protein
VIYEDQGILWMGIDEAYKAGDVVELPAGQAASLVARGSARRLAD